MPRTYDKDKYGRERTGQCRNENKQKDGQRTAENERASQKEKSDEEDKELARANEVRISVNSKSSIKKDTEKHRGRERLIKGTRREQDK